MYVYMYVCICMYLLELVRELVFRRDQPTRLVMGLKLAAAVLLRCLCNMSQKSFRAKP